MTPIATPSMRLWLRLSSLTQVILCVALCGGFGLIGAAEFVHGASDHVRGFAASFGRPFASDNAASRKQNWTSSAGADRPPLRSFRPESGPSILKTERPLRHPPSINVVAVVTAYCGVRTTF